MTETPATTTTTTASSTPTPDHDHLRHTDLGHDRLARPDPTSHDPDPLLPGGAPSGPRRRAARP
jgi:hypothetical protein